VTELELEVCHYSLERVAELLSVHKRTVERLVERGQLTVTYVTDDAPRISHNDLADYVASMKRGGDRRPTRRASKRRVAIIPSSSAAKSGPRPGRSARAA
jgi:excisionase family DNA binding protein